METVFESRSVDCERNANVSDLERFKDLVVPSSGSC